MAKRALQVEPTAPKAGEVPAITAAEQSIIDKLKAYAKDCYDYSYGWSQVHECWTDKEIVEVIREKAITSYTKLLAEFRMMVAVWNEQYRSHRNEARMGM